MLNVPDATFQTVIFIFWGTEAFQMQPHISQSPSGLCSMRPSKGHIMCIHSQAVQAFDHETIALLWEPRKEIKLVTRRRMYFHNFSNI